MKSFRAFCAVVCLALAWNPFAQAQAQGTGSWRSVTSFPDAASVQAPPPPAAVPSTPQAPPQQPGWPGFFPGQEAAPAAPADAFTQAPPSGTEAPGGGFAPQMIGDSLSYLSGRPPAFVTIGGVTMPATLALIRSMLNNHVTIQDPLQALAGSGFKIADNDSPLPQNRVFINFDYFTRVDHSLAASPVPGTPGDPTLRIAREIFGGEMTFAGGNASLEIRAPLFQYYGSDGTDIASIGDVTLVSKFAIINDETRVLSAGAALTLPSGPVYVNPFTQDHINPTILQPFVGYLMGSERWYVHAFSSFAIPLSDNLSWVWFNDIGAGWYAYRGSNGLDIVPTAEFHLTTPFGDRGSNSSPVAILDTLDSVIGTHLIFRDADLTLGIGWPWTGPQPFSTEFVMQFNLRF